MKAGPVYHGFHIEAPPVAIERCYSAQAALECNLGAVHKLGAEQVKVLYPKVHVAEDHLARGLAPREE